MYAPSRRLPKTFARERPKRWPYLVVAGFVAFVVVVAGLIELAAADRSDQAEEVLRTLGR